MNRDTVEASPFGTNVLALAVGPIELSSTMLTLLSMLPVPAVAIHELIHALASAPFASRVRVEFHPTGAATTTEWNAGVSLRAIRLAHVAPTLVGLGLAAVVLAVVGLPSTAWVTGSPVETALVVIAVLNWVVLTYPSATDRNPFK